MNFQMKENVSVTVNIKISLKESVEIDQIRYKFLAHSSDKLKDNKTKYFRLPLRLTDEVSSERPKGDLRMT